MTSGRALNCTSGSELVAGSLTPPAIRSGYLFARQPRLAHGDRADHRWIDSGGVSVEDREVRQLARLDRPDGGLDVAGVGGIDGVGAQRPRSTDAQLGGSERRA